MTATQHDANDQPGDAGYPSDAAAAAAEPIAMAPAPAPAPAPGEMAAGPSTGLAEGSVPDPSASYEEQRAAYEAQVRAAYEAQQRAAWEAQQRASYEAQVAAYEAQQRAAWEAQQRAAYEAQQRAAYEAQQRAAYEAQQRAAWEAQQRAAYDTQAVPQVGADPYAAGQVPAAEYVPSNATPAVVAPEPGPTAPLAEQSRVPATRDLGPTLDPITALKQRAQEALFEKMGGRLYDRSMTDEELDRYVTEEVINFFASQDVPLSPQEQADLAKEMADDVLRHGPIEPLLRDDSISEVMVNGTKPIYVERSGRLMPTPSRFVSDAHLRQVIDRIVSRIGRRIDESSPMVDGRLPDGSRVNAIIPPLAVDGPSLTIRKFTTDTFTPKDLIEHQTATPEVMALLEAGVKGRLNVLVSGGTGTGKTTLLNILSSYIPDDERIVTIEDSVELKLRQSHIVRLESRPSNIEGKGEVSIRDLVRNSLRMRPDRIVVGECRGAEALDMLQAMNTGHDGSLSTLHANTPRDALSRIETMVLMAGMDLPVRAIREQVASAVDLIVQLSRFRDGSRRITHVTEVVGMEGEIITLSDIYLLDSRAGYDEQGRFGGVLRPTGLRPRFADALAEQGFQLGESVFADNQRNTRNGR